MVVVVGFAQCPKLPEKYEWNSHDDYAKDKQLVTKTLRWLCVTPLGIEVQQRSIANAFVLEWLAGTDEFKLIVDSKVLPFQTEHPELLFTLLHGMALYMIDHPKENNTIKLHTEGLKVVANLATQSKELSKSRSMKKLIHAAKRNKLKAYTEKILMRKKEK